MGPLTFRQALHALESLPMDTVVQQARGGLPRVTTGELACRLVYGTALPHEVCALLVMAGLPLDLGGDEVAA